MKIKIYQIYFREEQKKYLDPSFIPFDNSNPQFVGKFETGVFLSEYPKLNLEEDEYVGFVSWKFGKKTKITGLEFIKFIKSSPPSDVYFTNPFPELEAFDSVWQQGELFHPGLIDIASNLLKVGQSFKPDLNKILPKEQFAYCNYWVGNKRFWDKYIRVLAEVDGSFDNLPNDSALRLKIERLADQKIRANYYPFIFERIFSSFLNINTEIRFQKYEYSNAKILRKIHFLAIPYFAGRLGKSILKLIISERSSN